MKGAYRLYWLLLAGGHLYRRNRADIAGACSGGKFVGYRAGQAYNGREPEVQTGNPG